VGAALFLTSADGIVMMKNEEKCGGKYPGMRGYMKFTKMQGCGNDYVYVNGFVEKIPTEDKPELVRRLSDRHFGIGGDGVIFINPAEEADFEMEMYNADGSRSEMCGNGIRCVAKYVYDKGLTDATGISIVSAGKIKYLDLPSGIRRVYPESDNV